MCAVVLLAINALLVALAGVACLAVGARPRWFLLSSIFATFAAYVIVTWWLVLPDIRAWERLKPAYPAESLEARLSYEDRTRAGARISAGNSERLALLETRIDKHVEETRRTSRTWRRDRALTHLHAGVVQQFISSPGFGPGRLPLPRPKDLETDDAEESRPDMPERPIRQPLPAYAPPDIDLELVKSA
jgi:hypothetical protein